MRGSKFKKYLFNFINNFAILYEIERVKMTITLNIPNEQLFDRILWLLNRFKNDGLEIVIPSRKPIQHQEEPQNKFSKFTGIWKDRDITQESIREQAWR